MIPFVVEAALRSAMAAVAVWACLRVFRVSNVVAQKAAWGLVLASAVLMPALLPLAARLPITRAVVLPAHPLSLLSRFRSATVPAVNETVAASLAVHEPQVSETDETSTPMPTDAVVFDRSDIAVAADRYPSPTISTTVASVPTVQPSLRRWNFSLIKIAWTLYLVVAAIFVFRLMYGLMAALNLWRAAEPVLATSISASQDGLRLRSSASLYSPVTIGSTVVLPADFADWDSEKLRIVLAHERSHVLQRDFYLQILAGLHAALFWFSPLGWWLKRKLSDLAEAISDRAGLNEAASRSTYAQILLEFAAAPRPTVLGVAMARSGSLTRRIDRLLNESAFRQAFQGTRRRALVALLIVPVAFFAAATLVRVEAAGQAPATEPTPAALPAPPSPSAPAVLPAPPAMPESQIAPGPASPSPAPSVDIEPPPPAIAAPAVLPSPDAMQAPAPAPAPAAPAVPPPPPGGIREGTSMGAGIGQDSGASQQSGAGASIGKGNGYSHSSSFGIHSSSHEGFSYAIIEGNWNNVACCGWMNERRGDFEKARQMAHGDFLWFVQGDHTYYVDDPAVMAQVKAVDEPYRSFGKQQEEMRKQQEDLKKAQEDMAHAMVKINVITPEMSQQISKLAGEIADLEVKKALSQQDWPKIQIQLGDLQGKLAEMEKQLNARQGEWSKKVSELSKLSELDRIQVKIVDEQRHLGFLEGRNSEEGDQKIKSIIDEILKNGAAHPVQ